MTKRVFATNLLILFLLFSVAPTAIAQSPKTITVSGTLINKTTGEPAPAGIPLMLHTFDNKQMSGMTDGVTAADGSFLFENIASPANRLFEMMATVGKTSYFSEVAPAPADNAALTLPVNYFDATTDSSGIRITQMHMVVDFFSPSLMQIAEIYIISNNSDKTVEDAVTLPDGNAAAVAFELPAGAVNLSFDQGSLGERFFQTDNGFADTAGIQPGAETSQFIVRYYLPYEEGVSVKHPLSYPTEKVSILVPQMGVSLTGDEFPLDSTRKISDGRMVDIYASTSTGTQFTFGLTGEPQLGQSPQPSADTPATTAPISGNKVRRIGIIILIAGVLVLAVGFWWWKQNPVAEEPDFDIPIPADLPADSDENEIVLALLELDETLAAGRISATDYDREREALRAELKSMLLRRHGTSAEVVVGH